jgi:hypothetical protein
MPALYFYDNDVVETAAGLRCLKPPKQTIPAVPAASYVTDGGR